MIQELTEISIIPLSIERIKDTETTQREFDKCFMCEYYN